MVKDCDLQWSTEWNYRVLFQSRKNVNLIHLKVIRSSFPYFFRFYLAAYDRRWLFEIFNRTDFINILRVMLKRLSNGTKTYFHRYFCLILLATNRVNLEYLTEKIQFNSYIPRKNSIHCILWSKKVQFGVDFFFFVFTWYKIIFPDIQQSNMYGTAHRPEKWPVFHLKTLKTAQ